MKQLRISSYQPYKHCGHNVLSFLIRDVRVVGKTRFYRGIAHLHSPWADHPEGCLAKVTWSEDFINSLIDESTPSCCEFVFDDWATKHEDWLKGLPFDPDPVIAVNWDFEEWNIAAGYKH